MEENKYSVKDLCNIFNINTNTFPSIAKRLNINTEEYCSTEINEFNSPKKYYNELAYKKIEEYALAKEKTIEDLRKQLDFTQKLLVTEKGEKQQLQQQIFLLSEDNKKINELETENKTLLNTNESYIKENHKLEGEKNELQKEIERLNNRGFFARLFNK